MWSLPAMLSAQVSNPGLKSTAPKTALSPKPQTLNTSPPNTMVQKLPDLKIVSFTVSFLDKALGDGIEINYTVKNEGTVAVAKGLVSITGMIGYGAADTRPFAGCGSGLGLNYEFLNPGETGSGSYRCYTHIERTGNPVYTLTLDRNNSIKELNENNNMAQASIL
jgi:hypothetical protein